MNAAFLKFFVQLLAQYKGGSPVSVRTAALLLGVALGCRPCVCVTAPSRASPDYLEAPSEFVIDKFLKERFIAEHEDKGELLGERAPRPTHRARAWRAPLATNRVARPRTLVRNGQPRAARRGWESHTPRVCSSGACAVQMMETQMFQCFVDDRYGDVVHNLEVHGARGGVARNEEMGQGEM